MKRGALIVLASAACGGEVHSTPVGQIPSEPSGPQTTSTDVSTFALDALFVGDTNFAGTASNDAWQSFGYNLDGRVTTKTSTNVCTGPGGSLATSLGDGDGLGGIDNSWGGGFLPTTVLVSGHGFFGPSEAGSLFAWVNPSSDVTSFIQSGAWTLEIVVRGLPTELAQDATGLDTQVFIGSTESGATFDDGSSWPVTPSSLADGQRIDGGARVHFRTTYVTERTVVARDSSEPLVVPLLFHNGGSQVCMMGGCSGPTANPVVVPLTLRIHDPIVTFVRNDTPSVTQGIIAGVLDPKELGDAVVLAWDLGPDGCDTSIVRSAMSNNLSYMTDIVHDETNASSVPCDAISIGLGFTAKPIANPTVVGTDTTVPTDTCTN